MIAMLTHSGGGGGMGEDGGEGDDAAGTLGGGGMCGIIRLIKWIILCGETFVNSSLSPHRGEIKGLFSGPLLPSFL